jgi:hypothetical protein
MGFFSFESSNTYVDDKGYERYTDSDKLVHRVVAAEKLGRPLKYWEVVHHKDRDKSNNSPNNLLVMSKKAHDQLHKRDAKKHGPKASYKGFDRKPKKKGFWDSLF